MLYKMNKDTNKTHLKNNFGNSNIINATITDSVNSTRIRDNIINKARRGAMLSCVG